MGEQAAAHPAGSVNQAGSSTADSGWTEAEQRIARQAFDQAQQRAIVSLIQTVQLQVDRLDDVESVWALHDFLSIQRHAMEGRFDFRLQGLLFVFASLVRDELLTLEELQGLDALKLAKISAMARI